MSLRSLATLAAITSALFGVLGIIVPGQMTSTLFGVELDVIGTTLVRLTCAAYIGYAVLAWSARDLTEARARRAIAVSNSVAWGLSGIVLALGLLSGLGVARAWAVVAMQVLFAAAWALALVRAESASTGSAAGSVALR
jgi:hypothetical protein